VLTAVIARVEGQKRLSSTPEKSRPVSKLFSATARRWIVLSKDEGCTGAHSPAALCPLFQHRQWTRELNAPTGQKTALVCLADDPYWRIAPMLLDPGKARVALSLVASATPLAVSVGALGMMARDELLFILDALLQFQGMRLLVTGVTAGETLAELWLRLLERGVTRPTRHWMEGDS
jgi:hypothetical protein